MQVTSIPPPRSSRFTRAVTSEDHPQPTSITRAGSRCRSIACSAHASSGENISFDS